MNHPSANGPGRSTCRWFPGPRPDLLGWGLALAGALALNLVLFGLMPGLIRQVPKAPDQLDTPVQVNVIRIKKAETPPRRKEPPKVKPPEPVRPKPRVQEAKPLRKELSFKPRLSFEINPRLPAAPMDLAMPPLEQFSMEGPKLKDLYDVSELDFGLIALVKVPPIYPIRARRREIQGSVTVEFTVTRQGLVEGISILEARPEAVFDTAVISCISRWKFRPPTVEGIPVATRARTTIKFTLGDG